MKIEILRDFSLSEIGKIVGGKVFGNHNKRIKFISTDTREDVSQSLFVAIKGKNFDGHNFIAEAKKKGAIAFITEREIEGEDFILVENSETAILKLGSYIKDEVNPKVVAIGGSAGKTTTKDLTHYLLQRKFKTIKTPKSFNTKIGIGITLLQLKKDVEIFVAEVGTSSPGEIEEISKHIKPDIAVITVIGKEHLEKLKSEEEVFKEEISLFDEVEKSKGENGYICFNSDDKRISEYISNFRAKKISFGKEEKADFNIKISDVNDLMMTTFSINGITLKTSLPPHFAIPVVASFTIERILSKDEEKEIDISDFSPQPGRFNVKKINGIIVVDDSFNSNPTSIEGMFFSISYSKRRKIFVLGDMLELGEKSEEEHINIGKMAKKYIKDGIFILLGDMRDIMEKGLKEEGFIAVKSERENVILTLKKIVKDGDIVVFKASRALKFEELVNEFIKNFRK